MTEPSTRASSCTSAAGVCGEPVETRAPDLWLDGDPLDPSAPLTDAALRDGSVVGIGAPARGDPPAVETEYDRPWPATEPDAAPQLPDQRFALHAGPLGSGPPWMTSCPEKGSNPAHESTDTSPVGEPRSTRASHLTGTAAPTHREDQHPSHAPWAFRAGARKGFPIGTCLLPGELGGGGGGSARR